MKPSTILHKNILYYGFYGFLLGLMFPVIGTLHELLRSGGQLSFLILQKLYAEQPLLWIIGLAPFVLATFSALIGLQTTRLMKTSARLDEQASTQESQIQKELFFFEALIKGSPFAVVQLDMNYRIISFNPAFEELFGYTGQEITGHNLDELITPEESRNEAVMISETVSSGQIIRMVSQRKKKDGSLFDAEIVGIPVFSGGEKIGILGLYHDISLNKETERILRESEERFRSVTQSAIDAIISADPSGKIITWNHGASQIFGYTETEAIGQQVSMLMPEQYHTQHWAGMARIATGGEQHVIGHTVELEGVRKDGIIFPMALSLSTWETAEGKYYSGIIRDISKRKQVEDVLRNSEARFKSLFDNSPISLWEEDFSEIKQVLDELAEDQDVVECLRSNDNLVRKCIGLAKILDVNQATLDLYDVRSKSELVESLSLVMVEDSLNSFRNELIALFSGENFFECEIAQKKGDGELITGLLYLSLAPGCEDTWEKVFISIMDITERKYAEDNLRFLSFHDLPTGLYNRGYFDTELERLQSSRQFPLSIIACDLDGLKQINDTLGHDTGDRAIKAAATILASIVFRKEDMVARIGGDEFAVILPNVELSENSSILARLEQAIADFNLSDDDDGLYRPISLSFGFAAIQQGGSLMDGYKRADQQMYVNKMQKKRKAGLIENPMDNPYPINYLGRR